MFINNECLSDPIVVTSNDKEEEDKEKKKIKKTILFLEVFSLTKHLCSPEHCNRG